MKAITIRLDADALGKLIGLPPGCKIRKVIFGNDSILCPEPHVDLLITGFGLEHHKYDVVLGVIPDLVGKGEDFRVDWFGLERKLGT